MSIYKKFSTDEELETKGVPLNYGDCLVTIARAGGANRKYSRLLASATKPYRRAIATDTMDPDVAMRLMYKVYAESVILNWETLVEGKLVKGIENPDPAQTKLLPVTPENLVATFELLPDMFLDIQEQAGQAALFRQDQLEDDAGN